MICDDRMSLQNDSLFKKTEYILIDEKLMITA
jgi:hypothetical protein